MQRTNLTTEQDECLQTFRKINKVQPAENPTLYNVQPKDLTSRQNQFVELFKKINSEKGQNYPFINSLKYNLNLDHNTPHTDAIQIFQNRAMYLGLEVIVKGENQLLFELYYSKKMIASSNAARDINKYNEKVEKELNKQSKTSVQKRKVEDQTFNGIKRQKNHLQHHSIFQSPSNLSPNLQNPTIVALPQQQMPSPHLQFQALSTYLQPQVVSPQQSSMLYEEVYDSPFFNSDNSLFLFASDTQQELFRIPLDLNDPVFKR